MPDPSTFPPIFNRLKSILQVYENHLVVTEDTLAAYSLNAPFSKKFKKEVFFGAVMINKNYVSFHLMPVYIYPDLLDGLSAALKKHMQGKSCFNFKTADESLFVELEQLTRASVARVKAENLL
ncbi:MAG: hypothetical protein P4L50_23935 [Anaerolineaceae bacterium]|nr:hypothetical protein [Anaerolineaceae bacterium]